MRLLRLAWYTAVHLAYRTGLRGYCWPCDALRWRWTHRRCAARAHAAGAELAAWLRQHPDVAHRMRGAGGGQ